jgi:hypothetical protein
MAVGDGGRMGGGLVEGVGVGEEEGGGGMVGLEGAVVGMVVEGEVLEGGIGEGRGQGGISMMAGTVVMVVEEVEVGDGIGERERRVEKEKKSFIFFAFACVPRENC